MKLDHKKIAKDGAQRKREHDERQRRQGRRPLQLWVTADENRQIREFLWRLREKF